MKIKLSVNRKIEELGWTVLPHPPYSPDLAPSEYHLIRSMHHGLSEKKFNNIDEVRSWVASYFDSQPTKFFDDGIQMIDGEALLIVVENIVWNKDLL
ncbi:hypothetical protein RB195_012849 [Necator americanus]|uniref:Histone-lysine N-methyltransferase SETMAR n=1 Tax=Necator americanus TaxID=51031 RepID=A0ABR1DT35_NECAM